MRVTDVPLICSPFWMLYTGQWYNCDQGCDFNGIFIKEKKKEPCFSNVEFSGLFLLRWIWAGCLYAVASKTFSKYIKCDCVSILLRFPLKSLYIKIHGNKLLLLLLAFTFLLGCHHETNSHFFFFPDKIQEKLISTANLPEHFTVVWGYDIVSWVWVSAIYINSCPVFLSKSFSPDPDSTQMAVSNYIKHVWQHWNND